MPHTKLNLLSTLATSFWFLIVALSVSMVAPTAIAQSETTESQDAISTYTAAMTTHAGFFTFYHDATTGKYYLQVPVDAPEFIFQTSLPWGLGSNDIGLDRGQLGATRLANFHIEGDKVLLVEQNTKFRASSPNAAERASIQEAFADSVIAGFAVAAKNDTSVLIDYTPFLLSDVHGVSASLERTKQGSFKVAADRSVVYPERSRSFPENTELEAKVTFAGKGTGAYLRSVAPDPDAITLHLHHSFIALPDDGYQPRAFHPQSGFWSHAFEDYSAPLGQSTTVQYIPRHRFSADEPIIYYLDPGVPEPVRTALLDGGRWWADAFAAAGFPDGFRVEILPADADPMDVRYNVIQWVHRSTRGWSYGASVIDPRTGEILKGHVTLGSLRVRQDMKIAQGLLAPYAEDLTEAEQQQRLAAVEAMALARIRQLSAHEIGHTLGIAHNFAASGDDRASVMDYPHPLVSIDTDTNGLTLAAAYKEGIGLWDKRVVAYGYGTEPLAAVIEQNRALGLSYISDRDARPAGGAHPDAHLWDNGSDAVTELERILAVRQTALENFGLANLAPNEPISRLQDIFVPMYLLHRYQTEAAVKMLGGVHYDYAIHDGTAEPLRAVNGSQQQRALRQLLRTIDADTLAVNSTIQGWLQPLAYGEPSNREHFRGATGLIPDAHAMATSSAAFSLDLLLHPERLGRLQQQHAHDDTIPAVAAVLNGIAETTLVPAQQAQATALEQQLALTSLTAIVHSYQAATSNALLQAQLQAFLLAQRDAWQDAAPSATQAFVMNAFESWFTRGQWPLTKAQPLPPGSPI
ncbi:zinc-dependent metalloprotease [Pseudidiomarina aestuarii]|uniref:zinc-dependent metalloprotease n=1 Tax=Pseudidiomarina aestuarii TaxID=624146 RepID=UPI003A985B1E